MRILWHGPYDTPTGYWNQADIWLRRLIAAGHEVAISCLAGSSGHMAAWPAVVDGAVVPVPVYPHTPYETLGQDVVRGHYEHFKADLVITLTCTWVFNPAAWRDMRVIHITPVDIDGMSDKDYAVIANSGGTPAAVCRYGQAQMQGRGLDPLYLPHGVETGVFRPPDNRKVMRRAISMDHLFIVGMNFANHDRTRKRVFEQIAGFAAFHEAHPKSLLALHTLMSLPEGLDLPAIIRELDLADAVIFSDQYQLITGMTDRESLAAWYGTCDVVLTAGNEGFNLVAVEAQACGTPVITANWSTGPEVRGAGWGVDGQADWNDWHKKRWQVPLISSVTAALENSYRAARDQGVRDQARAFALEWDADTQWGQHWAPVIDELG
jgi:glycosyltransferase involved in cell wall biosynthesis